MTTPQQEREMFRERFYLTKNAEGRTYLYDSEAEGYAEPDTITDYWLDRLAQREAEIREAVEEMRDYEEYDVMVCGKCNSTIRERTSHHSEGGYSECCGKKLKRVQGAQDAYTPKNETLNEVLSLLTPSE